MIHRFRSKLLCFCGYKKSDSRQGSGSCTSSIEFEHEHTALLVWIFDNEDKPCRLKPWVKVKGQ